MNAANPKDRQVNCRLDSELHDTLIETAREHDMPVSMIVRFAVRDYLARAREGIRL